MQLLKHLEISLHETQMRFMGFCSYLQDKWKGCLHTITPISCQSPDCCDSALINQVRQRTSSQLKGLQDLDSTSTALYFLS